MTRNDYVQAAIKRFRYALDELSNRYCGTVAQGQIQDPFLDALGAAVAENLGNVEYRCQLLAPSVLGRLNEAIRGGPVRLIPPTTTVQISPRGSSNIVISAGSQLRTDGKGPAASFRTTTTIKVRPWAADCASYSTGRIPALEYHPQRRSCVTFRLTRARQATARLNRVRVFVDAPDEIAWPLLQGMFHHSCGVFVSSDEKNWKPIRIRPVGFGDSSSLYPTSELDSAKLVREFFAYPRKHYYVDLLELDLPPDASQAVVALTFTTAIPAMQRLEAQALRLNCVPAVNLYSLTADTVRVEDGKTEYPIKGLRLPGHASVYSIDSITEVGRDERVEKPIRRPCGHQYGIESSDSLYRWHVAQHDEGWKLSVIAGRKPPQEMISRLEIMTTCTDGDIATGHAAGTSFVVDGSPCTATLLHAPTPMMRCEDQDSSYQMFEQIGPARWSLLGRQATEVLQARLRHHALCGWTAPSGRPASRIISPESAIGGLIGLLASSIGGYEVTFDPAHYPGSAPWLFAEVVRRYLRSTQLGQRPNVAINLNQGVRA